MVKLIDILSQIPQNLNGYASIKQILEKFHKFLKDETNYLNLVSYFTTCKISSLNFKKIPYYTEYEDRRDEIFKICLKAIEKGISDGSISDEIDSHIIIYSIWAGVGSFWEYIMKDNVLRPIKVPYLKQIDLFLEAYFKLILKAIKKMQVIFLNFFKIKYC